MLAQCGGAPSLSPAPPPTRQATPMPRATIQPTARPEPLLSYREVIDLVHPSIVRLSTGGSSGSGFIIRTLENSAYVATNQHVIDDAGKTVSAVVGDRAIYPGLVIGEDDQYDFAVVWICCSEEFQGASARRGRLLLRPGTRSGPSGIRYGPLSCRPPGATSTRSNRSRMRRVGIWKTGP